jgi:UrcA family protein
LLAIPKIAAEADICLVDRQTSLPKELEMNKTIATATRALTICVAATFGFNAVNASANGIANDPSTTNPPRTYTVRFADLDVSKMEGAKTLYARLRHAAKEVCKPLETAYLWHSDQSETCMNKAIADAVARVDRPLLSQYHQSRTMSNKTHNIELAKAN